MINRQETGGNDQNGARNTHSQTIMGIRVFMSSRCKGLPKEKRGASDRDYCFADNQAEDGTDGHEAILPCKMVDMRMLEHHIVPGKASSQQYQRRYGRAPLSE